MVTLGSEPPAVTVTAGEVMVRTGHGEIRRVRFVPPAPSVGDIEVNTLRGIRDRGGPHEFLTSQRLDFDLVMEIESGAAVHTVDFDDHTLRTGDILWVRAGQVHRWGAIGEIDGPVVMFGPHSIAERTRDLTRSHLVRPQSHWPAADLAGTPTSDAFALLTRVAESGGRGRNDLHQAGLTHSLGALLVELVQAAATGGAPTPGATHEAYAWFLDHVEEHFRRWHKVGEYADRVGYSARTLNRLARRHTGLTAKGLIDERIVLEAKRLLNHTDASVSEIAEGLGFDDASNFSSYFRGKAGMTPGAFRRVIGQ
jgi:AraC-like DNA-binding protein